MMCGHSSSHHFIKAWWHPKSSNYRLSWDTVQCSQQLPYPQHQYCVSYYYHIKSGQCFTNTLHMLILWEYRLFSKILNIRVPMVLSGLPKNTSSLILTCSPEEIRMILSLYAIIDFIFSIFMSSTLRTCRTNSDMNSWEDFLSPWHNRLSWVYAPDYMFSPFSDPHSEVITPKLMGIGGTSGIMWSWGW